MFVAACACACVFGSTAVCLADEAYVLVDRWGVRQPDDLPTNQALNGYVQGVACDAFGNVYATDHPWGRLTSRAWKLSQDLAFRTVWDADDGELGSGLHYSFFGLVQNPAAQGNSAPDGDRWGVRAGQ